MDEDIRIFLGKPGKPMVPVKRHPLALAFEVANREKEMNIRLDFAQEFLKKMCASETKVPSKISAQMKKEGENEWRERAAYPDAHVILRDKANRGSLLLECLCELEENNSEAFLAMTQSENSFRRLSQFFRSPIRCLSGSLKYQDYLLEYRRSKSKYEDCRAKQLELSKKAAEQLGVKLEGLTMALLDDSGVCDSGTFKYSSRNYDTCVDCRRCFNKKDLWLFGYKFIIPKEEYDQGGPKDKKEKIRVADGLRTMYNCKECSLGSTLAKLPFYEMLGSASIKISLRELRERNGSTSKIDDFEDGVWHDHLWKTMSVIPLEQGAQENYEEDSKRDVPKYHPGNADEFVFLW